MTIHHLNPPELFDSTPYGFSQVVVATGARVIAVSGQVAWTPERALVGAGDLEAEATRALRNLETALRTADADLGNVISLRIYVVDYTPADSDAITRALTSVFAADRRPTATWIGVSTLARPDLRIEIEAMAIA